MSNSYRKNVFSTYHSSKGMKRWRTQENRRLRHNAKQIINTCEDYDELIIPVLNDYDTLWGSPQDGRKRLIPVPALNECEIEDSIWFRMFGINRNLHTGHQKPCSCYGKDSRYWRLKRQ